MNIIVRGENIEVTEALQNYVEKKIGRIEKYFNDAPSTISVTLRVLREVHTVEVTMQLHGLFMRAEEDSNDMYASIDMVVEKLERQIRKFKTKINRKFRQQDDVRTLFKEGDQGNKNGNAFDEDELEVVRIKRFNLKPMDLEEAILQMDMLGHNFFVFSNADTEEINVVYKRKDGKYGLIEPEF